MTSAEQGAVCVTKGLWTRTVAGAPLTKCLYRNCRHAARDSLYSQLLSCWRQPAGGHTMFRLACTIQTYTVLYECLMCDQPHVLHMSLLCPCCAPPCSVTAWHCCCIWAAPLPMSNQITLPKCTSVKACVPSMLRYHVGPQGSTGRSHNVHSICWCKGATFCHLAIVWSSRTFLMGPSTSRRHIDQGPVV